MEREYRVDIETDSTIQADVQQAQTNASLFLQGLGTYFTAVGPAVISGFMQPRLRKLMNPDQLLTAAAITFGCGISLTALVPVHVLALLTLALCGAAQADQVEAACARRVAVGDAERAHPVVRHSAD